MSNADEPVQVWKQTICTGPLERNMELVTMLKTAYGLGTIRVPAPAADTSTEQAAR